MLPLPPPPPYKPFRSYLPWACEGCRVQAPFCPPPPPPPFINPTGLTYPGPVRVFMCRHLTLTPPYKPYRSYLPWVCEGCHTPCLPPPPPYKPYRSYLPWACEGCPPPYKPYRSYLPWACEGFHVQAPYSPPRSQRPLRRR